MESKLWRDKRGRETYDTAADLYAIIKTTERLERAYIRDIVSSTDYEFECNKLISQFKSLVSSLKDAAPVVVEEFARTHCTDCPTAINRLFSGVPANRDHSASLVALASSSTTSVAECVQHFITAMDSVKLNMVAVDQVYPLLSDLSSSLAKLTGSILPDDFEGRAKFRDWLSRLSKMAAADELTEQEARQLYLDLDSSYAAFMKTLSKDDDSA